MKSDPHAERATAEVERRVHFAGPPEPRVVHLEAEVEWEPDLLRNRRGHELAVLGRGPDLVVFFDEEGREIGWRDDAATGAAMPAWIDREAFRRNIVKALGLPSETRLGKLEPAELPPLGWTHEAVLFTAPAPRPDQVLRVWVDPVHLRVIQILAGNRAGESG